MISRTHRFHGFNALRHVYGRGRTVRSPLFTIKYQLNERRSSYRAAVVVSRKIHKSAVVRNRIRRRMYEIIRHAAPDMRGSYDIVVTVYSDQVGSMDTAVLESMVIEQLSKAGVLQKPVPHRSHGIVVPKENRPNNV